MEKGQYHLLFPLHFVRCGVCCCGAVAPRVTAALLGRFLPRLGPLAIASGPFFWSVRSAVWLEEIARTLAQLAGCGRRPKRSRRCSSQRDRSSTESAVSSLGLAWPSL